METFANNPVIHTVSSTTPGEEAVPLLQLTDEQPPGRYFASPAGWRNTKHPSDSHVVAALHAAGRKFSFLAPVPHLSGDPDTRKQPCSASIRGVATTKRREGMLHRTRCGERVAMVLLGFLAVLQPRRAGCDVVGFWKTGAPRFPWGFVPRGAGMTYLSAIAQVRAADQLLQSRASTCVNTDLGGLLRGLTYFRENASTSSRLTVEGEHRARRAYVIAKVAHGSIPLSQTKVDRVWELSWFYVTIWQRSKAFALCGPLTVAPLEPLRSGGISTNTRHRYLYLWWWLQSAFAAGAHITHSSTRRCVDKLGTVSRITVPAYVTFDAACIGTAAEPQTSSRRLFADPQNASSCRLAALLPNSRTTCQHYQEFPAVSLRSNPSEKVAAQRSICQSQTREVYTPFSRSWSVSRATHPPSAHDKAAFRNDPAPCCKLRRKASAPASQPCVQTLLRPPDTSLLSAPGPLCLRFCASLSHAATGGQWSSRWPVWVWASRRASSAALASAFPIAGFLSSVHARWTSNSGSERCDRAVASMLLVPFAAGRLCAQPDLVRGAASPRNTLYDSTELGAMISTTCKRVLCAIAAH
ncbi:hypothetical protein SVAN01_11853 [Stagonosporopsis vannaccii]|nr:hypothetical protein SVAN01_11853 [Stagonosporopsis vannaccii]